MNQHTTLTTVTRLSGLQSLLNPKQDSGDAGSTCANSEYENTQSISEPRSTVQLSGPGQPMPTILPTTPVGFMPSAGGSSLANSSQSMNSQFPTINDPRRKLNLERQMTFSIEPSYRYEALKNTRLQSMRSQPGTDATGDFSSPPSTTATLRSQLSVASPEAHIHPPYAAISPQDVQGIQDPSTHLLHMQSYVGTPLSEKAAPLWHERLFETPKESWFLAIPGSDDAISIPVDAQGSRKMQEKRNRNAAASKRHREKKRKEQNKLSEELDQLRMEMREMRERMKNMEEEQRSHQELIRQAPWLSHLTQASDFPSQKSKTTAGMDDLATRPQNYGGGSSPGGQRLKRRRMSQVPELPTLAGAFVDLPTSRRGSELPPKQDLHDTPTRWFMSQNSRVSTSPTMVASVR